MTGAIATLDRLTNQDSGTTFVTNIAEETAPPGLTEATIRFISARNGEPDWLLAWRLKAYRHWLTMRHPTWQKVQVPRFDVQAATYYAAPVDARAAGNELDPRLAETYERLGVPIRGDSQDVAVHAVFDSRTVATTLQQTLAAHGVVFCSLVEAVQRYPELVRRYLGSVVPYSDNLFATLNSAVFSDGAFVYVPDGVTCPVPLSSHFRINAANTGQFERTLIIAGQGARVAYTEACTAAQQAEHRLHAGVAELVALDDAEITYSTIQQWPAGGHADDGGVDNFDTKRGACRGRNARIAWTQVETGARINWKYPACVLEGDNSVGESYTVSFTNGQQQADTGAKMIHLGRNTRSRIVAKGISAGHADQTYRGLVRMTPKADGARNFTQCDSMLIGSTCGAHTVPYIENKNRRATAEHEATTSKVSADQLFYCRQRGMSEEKAVALVVNGFCQEVLQHLPLNMAMEAQRLLDVSLEGSVG